MVYLKTQMLTHTNWSTFFSQRLHKAEQENLYRSLETWDNLKPGYLNREGELYINLSSNDYLGLCTDMNTHEEAVLLAEILPPGASASRLITGNLAIHVELEKMLAEWKKTEAALVFPSGYQTNIGLISALAGRGDSIFCDRLNHASIMDGCRMTESNFLRYRHADLNDLEQQIQQQGNGKRIIITDGVFSMDGEIAPLRELNELAQRYDALLIVDEAHATGVIGPQGAGSWAHSKLRQQEHVILMGTLSKAIGAQGGFICASKMIIEYLKNYCRSFIYSTGLSPFLAGIAHYNIARIRTEKHLLQKLRKNIRIFHTALKKELHEIPEMQTPILPIIIGEAQAAIDCAQRLRDERIVVLPIRPPTVPEGTARLRVSISAAHVPQDLRESAKIIAKHVRLSG